TGEGDGRWHPATPRGYPAAMTAPNGTTNGTPDLAALKEQRRVVRARLELLRLEHAQRVMEDAIADQTPTRIYQRQTKTGSRVPEDAPWAPIGGMPVDFGGSALFFRARVEGGNDWVPISVPSDRRHGQQWP